MQVVHMWSMQCNLVLFGKLYPEQLIRSISSSSLAHYQTSIYLSASSLCSFKECCIISRQMAPIPYYNLLYQCAGKNFFFNEKVTCNKFILTLVREASDNLPGDNQDWLFFMHSVFLCWYLWEISCFLFPAATWRKPNMQNPKATLTLQYISIYFEHKRVKASNAW